MFLVSVLIFHHQATITTYLPWNLQTSNIWIAFFGVVISALLWMETECVPIQALCHKLTLAKHNLCTKKRTRRKLCPCRQTTTRGVCMVCVFTQMATRGIWYQLHLLPRSLFASDMAQIESARFSCPGFDWSIRYLCVALIGGCCWNLRRAPDQEDVLADSMTGNLSWAFSYTEFFFSIRCLVINLKFHGVFHRWAQ